MHPKTRNILILSSLPFLCCILPIVLHLLWVIYYTTSPSLQEIADSVPLGSKIKDLDQYLEGNTGDYEVKQVPESKSQSPTYSGRIQVDIYGVKPRSEWPTIGVIDFTYKDGILHKKDWGYLPG